MAKYTCDECGERFDSAPAYAGHKTGCGNLPWDDPDELRELYYEQHMSLSEIADRWEDATRDKIAWQFQKHGIETRSRGEGKRLAAGPAVSISWVRGRYRVEFREFGEHRQFQLARLVALVDHSLEEMSGKHVHHKNGHPFDDRPENLEVMDKSEHHRHHAPNDGPDPDPEKLREAAERRDRDEQGRFV